jgi:hypothetical protein
LAAGAERKGNTEGIGGMNSLILKKKKQQTARHFW